MKNYFIPAITLIWAFGALSACGSLSAPWQAQDIGSVGFAGSTNNSAGTFTLVGSGADIYGTADACQFAYQQITGNCTIIARVDTVQDTNTWAKAGVMIRETLNANAAEAATLVTPGAGTTFQSRSTTGGSTDFVQTTGSAPYWVALTRNGNTFSGYVSPDGINWTPSGTPVTISMASTYYVGLAVTSHDNTQACTATLDSITLTGGLPPPWQNQDVGSVGFTGSSSASGGTFTLTGSGTDIYGTADACQFMYQPISGDCTVVARVASIQNTNAWAKAGVMIRDTLDADAMEAATFVTPLAGTSFQYRSDTGDDTTAGQTPGSAPYWVKLVRGGNTFSSYISHDGNIWLSEGPPVTIPMATTVYVGVAVTSHDNTQTCTATLDNVSVSVPYWRIGLNDGSNAEFTGTGNMPTSYTIPSDWSMQTTWPQWPPAPPANTPWTTTINYNLATVPPNGVMFTFKAVNASMMIPELAVYSNFAPCGIIQIGGAQYPGFGPPDTYTRTFTRAYQIYIPPQFLVAGANQLQISALGSPYNRSTTIFLPFTIDYMELDSLAAPPLEPINGKVTYTGINDGGFDINSSTIAIDQDEAEWMGVAYCGNPERIAFWNNLTDQTPAARLSYLQELQSLDMTCILDGWNCADTTDSEIIDGQLPDDGSATYINSLFSSYGSLVQFYEICNEPCQSITSASNQYCTAVANYVNTLLPANVQLTSPGYAYGGGYGDPINWDDGANYANRTMLDGLCDAYDGHAYGSSYGYDNGNLAETIDADGLWVDGNPQITNGWSKPFVVTECGSGSSNADAHEVCTSADEEYSSALDRNLRAHIAFADYFCAHAMFNNGTTYDYINGTQTDPTTWVANPSNSAEGDMDTRPKALRRLVLAYGTHGAPLPYTWQTPPTTLPSSSQGPVYFRAVDTSTLPPLPGSGATSSKILLSFVNFDLLNSNTISVNVTMPAAKTYSGVSYNSATSFTSAQTILTGLTATPTLPLSVTLGPGESVEYILDR